MATNVFRQQQTRKSDTYLDNLPPGVTLETGSGDLPDDLDALRSQQARNLDATGGTKWYSDIPTVNSKKRSILQLNTDLDAQELRNIVPDIFTPTTGQTVFTLSKIPIDPNIALIFVNGQKQAISVDFTLAGTILTMTLPYQLNSGDLLEAFIT